MNSEKLENEEPTCGVYEKVEEQRLLQRFSQDK